MICIVDKTVVGIAHALGQLRNIAAVLVRDSETCGVVARLIDTVARRQASDRASLKVIVEPQILLRAH